VARGSLAARSWPSSQKRTRQGIGVSVASTCEAAGSGKTMATDHMKTDHMKMAEDSMTKSDMSGCSMHMNEAMRAMEKK
jgi:hypothetical protein